MENNKDTTEEEVTISDVFKYMVGLKKEVSEKTGRENWRT